MEGTISLGVYNSTGQLVRTLKKEATTEDFTVGLDALATDWDGKDDAGNVVPAGRYEARGFVVGELHFTGEAYLCNDWITEEDSPRIRRIADLQCAPDGSLLMEANLATDGTSNWWHFDGTKLSGTLAPADPKISTSVHLAEGETLVDQSKGLNDCSWLIVRLESGLEVRQYSASGEFQRRLAIKPEDPQPTKIAGSPTADQFYLLEESSTEQRVRGLALAENPPEAGTSTWRVTFSKAITYSDSLEAVKTELQSSSGKPFEPQPSLRVTLRPNPLLKDQTSVLEVKVTFDAAGSYLTTIDGLILKTATDTDGLRWAAISQEPGSKAVQLFQSDGSVVEEFSTPRLANMMAFDCGDFEFTPPKQ